MKGTDTITIEHILGRMQADTSVDAPADSLKYVKKLFRTRALEQRVGVIERIAAILRVDLSPQRPLLASVQERPDRRVSFFLSQVTSP